MMKRLSIFGLLVFGLVGLVAPAAVAGGWAITSFDELPGEFQAGEPYLLGYTILQHGKTPVDGAETYITARNTETGKTIRFTGEPDGEPGHYVAEVTFPESGAWSWSVSQGFFAEYELGELTVAAAPVPMATAPPAAPAVTSGLPGWALPLGAATAVGLGMFMAQLMALIRRRSVQTGLAD